MKRKNDLGYTEFTESSLSAYNNMSGTENLPPGLTPTIIVKFFRLEDKLANNTLRKNLNKKQQINGKKTYMNEPLLPIESNINQEKIKNGFITSSWNCSVSILCKNDRGQVRYEKVDYVEDLKTMKNAIKKQPMDNRATSSKRGASEMKMSRESRNYTSFSPKVKKK